MLPDKFTVAFNTFFLVTQSCRNDLCHHRFRLCFGTCLAPSHCHTNPRTRPSRTYTYPHLVVIILQMFLCIMILSCHHFQGWLRKTLHILLTFLYNSITSISTLLVRLFLKWPKRSPKISWHKLSLKKRNQRISNYNIKSLVQMKWQWIYNL